MKYFAVAVAYLLLTAPVSADNADDSIADDIQDALAVAQELDRLVVLMMDDVLKDIVCRLAFETYTPDTLGSALGVPRDQLMRRINTLRGWGLVRLVATDSTNATIEPTTGRGTETLRRWALRYCVQSTYCKNEIPEAHGNLVKRKILGTNDETPKLSDIVGPVILFDGVCKLCNSSVEFVVKRDKRKRFHFAPLQSSLAETLLDARRDKADSVVLIQDGKAYYKSTAALLIAKRLDGIWPVFSVFLAIPERVRNAVYDLIGSRRYRIFGKRQDCWVPQGDTADRFLDSNSSRKCNE